MRRTALRGYGFMRRQLRALTRTPNSTSPLRGCSVPSDKRASTVMETRLYRSMSCVEVVPPSGQDLEDVHEAYVAMAASGIVTEAQRAVFTAVSKQLVKECGVEAIMLGGTDLTLAFNERDTEFPLIDCAGIHADAIAKLAAI